MNKKLKLNLGSGRDYLEGWVNIDIITDNAVDVIADLSKKFPFDDNSVDELLASDILEHFTKEKGKQFLEECYRVLKKNGKITIRTHNIYQIYRNFLHDPDVLVHFLYGDTSEGGIFGAHKYAYTRKSISLLLQKIGFRVESFTLETTNFVIIARKESKEEKDITIGIVMQSPDLGGAETYMLSLVENFLKADSKVFIASNKGRFLDRAKKFPIKTTEIPFIFDIIGNYRGLIKSTLFLPYELLFYSKLLRTYKKNNVDVILMSGYSEKLLVTWIASFFDIPVVWIEYGPLQTVFSKLMKLPKVAYRLTKHLPKAVIVPTRNTKQSLITDARVSLAKLHIIPCGTNIVKQRKNTKTILIPEWGNNFVIGNISRQTREKGQEVLIRAMPYVLKKVFLARLLIVGDGPDLHYYQELVVKLGIEKYVLFTGFVKDTQQYYDSMDLFVFPTVWDLEGFGVVLIEAMMHRLPTIGSDMGPVPEIIDDQKSGLLFKTGDEKELAKAINFLYKDDKKREMVANNGYKKALKNYNIVTISKKILGILTDAIYKSIPN